MNESSLSQIINLIVWKYHLIEPETNLIVRPRTDHPLSYERCKEFECLSENIMIYRLAQY